MSGRRFVSQPWQLVLESLKEKQLLWISQKKKLKKNRHLEFLRAAHRCRNACGNAVQLEEKRSLGGKVGFNLEEML
jgi:hypothetical protein